MRKRANDVTDIIMHFQNLVSYLQPRFLLLALNVYKNIFINSNEEIKIYTETKNYHYFLSFINILLHFINP